MRKWQMNIRLFGDGSGAGLGAGGASAGAEGTGGGAAGEGTEQLSPTLARKARIAAAFAKNSELGQQEEEQAAEETEPTGQPAEEEQKELTPEERRAEFERLIKSEYKDLYQEKIRADLDRRLKGQKAVSDQLQALQPMVDMLAQKYGVDSRDVAALTQKLQEDDALYEQEATEKGMSVQQLREIKRLQRENAEFHRMQEQARFQQQADSILNRWMEQGEKLKEIYPGFDFETESENPQFMSLLKAGVDVQAAYQAVHMDDILGGAMQYTAQKVKESTVSAIKSRSKRPSENGGTAQSGSITKNKALTREDRARLVARAMAGESVQL